MSSPSRTRKTVDTTTRPTAVPTAQGSRPASATEYSAAATGTARPTGG